MGLSVASKGRADGNTLDTQIDKALWTTAPREHVAEAGVVGPDTVTTCSRSIRQGCVILASKHEGDGTLPISLSRPGVYMASPG